MRMARFFLQKHPVLVLGLVTFGLFIAAEASGQAPRVLIPVLRVLIAPLWGMRTLEMLVGMGNWPTALQLLIALPLLFVPYVVADAVLQRLRRRRGPRVSAV